MPMWMDPEVWKGLKVFWIDPHSEDKSGKCSKARNTSVGGHGPSRHTSGQKTYARRALESISIFCFSHLISYSSFLIMIIILTFM